ncbi:MAG: alpha-L-fucosidase [Thermoproteota archaeon]
MEIQSGPFEPTWESLRTFKCPEWFRDAKFGIWAHWGPQSAPMAGDWYARNMYIEGHEQYLHHWRHYGHPSKFGYKDIIKLWKAERFDPDALMDLYVKAGARYFVVLAVHHDNFDNWNSKHHRWNAVNFGPHKDIVGLFERAARKRGLKFGVSEHLGAAFQWFSANKGSDKTGPYAGIPYDGNDPEYKDLYLPNREEFGRMGYTSNAWWHQRWFERIKDLIDQYNPDLLYTDGGVPFYWSEEAFRLYWPKEVEGRRANNPEPGLHIIAHLYNTSVKIHGTNQAVYTQKDPSPEVYRVGVLDIERGMQAGIAEHPWQIDTCIGNWHYHARQPYKTPKHIIDILINTVSKNGNLLLNFPLRPDGTLDDEELYILARLAEWMEIHGEAIYGTRPWKVAGEGPLLAPESGPFKEAEIPWTEQDYRFTSKGGVLYAFQMRWSSNGKALIHSLASDVSPKVQSVQLLGFEGEIQFHQTWFGLGIRLPDKPVTEFAHCFRIELEEKV